VVLGALGVGNKRTLIRARGNLRKGKWNGE
jgi:hypothetical protein